MNNIEQYFNKALSHGLVCTLNCNGGHTHAIIYMTSISGDPFQPGVEFSVKCLELNPGYHGLHIHVAGNLSNGCETAGGHYNPTAMNHGDLNDPRAHYGDLGNLYIGENRHCETILISNLVSLIELLGRSIVIHANKDDLGLGGNAESLKTGNSGARICCGVIGLC